MSSSSTCHVRATTLSFVERGKYVARLAVTSLVPNTCCRRRGPPARAARCPDVVHVSTGRSWYSGHTQQSRLGHPQAQGGKASIRRLAWLVVLEDSVGTTTCPTSNRTPKPSQPEPWPAMVPSTTPSASCPSLPISRCRHFIRLDNHSGCFLSPQPS